MAKWRKKKKKMIAVYTRQNYSNQEVKGNQVYQQIRRGNPTATATATAR